MKPYITYEEVMEKSGNSGKGYKLLTEENGCVNGCCSGITIYSDVQFSEKQGCHDDQEGFFVLEGEGEAMLDGQVFRIKAGDSFVAGKGVKHTVRTLNPLVPVRVFWFHSAV